MEEGLPPALNEGKGRVNRIIYGSVSSWRLGRLLGVDIVSTEDKTCSFDCIYCQLGKTIHPLGERREFVTMAQLAHELKTVRGIAVDYATFRLFRGEYQGKLALQMMFIEANRSYASEMAKLAEELSPDEVQLNTPLRPCTVNPLTPEGITAIRQEFSGVKGVVAVYEALRPEVTPLDLEETLRRRPKL